MKLTIGTEITSETIFGKKITGTITAILDKNVIVEGSDGRQLVRKSLLKKQGYSLTSVKPHNRKKINY